MSDKFNIFAICWNGECHSIISILFLHRPSWKAHQLICSCSHSDVIFGTPYYYSILIPFNHMHIEIRIFLFMRPQAPVTLDIGLRRCCHQVILLEIFQVLREPGMVFCAVGLINLISCKGEGVYGIASHASLYAASCEVTRLPNHLLLLPKVFNASIHMGETVYGIPCQVGSSCDQILEFRVVYKVKGLRQYSNGRHELRAISFH